MHYMRNLDVQQIDTSMPATQIGTCTHSCCLPCRQRDSEIAALRAALSERDDTLQDSRSELAELHAQVKSHEEGLQQAYNQLAEASRDKARVRQQLLENQAELTGVSHC